MIVAGYAIETPRLLLNSACPGFENGLANSSGTVGRYLMAQAGNVVLGRFDELVRMYKAPPAHALTEEFYETDPKRGFARGFAIQTVGPLPIAFAKQMMAAKGAWGWGLRRVMMDYNHWAAFGLLGEILPQADNRVELAEEKDHFGIPVAKITFNLHDNDKKLIEFGKNKIMEVMRAAGAEEVVQEARYRASGRRGAHGQRSAHLGRRPVRTHARYRQPLRLRRQHHADARIGQSGAHHPGVGGTHRRLSDHARRRDLSSRSGSRHGGAAAPVGSQSTDTFGSGVPRPAAGDRVIAVARGALAPAPAQRIGDRMEPTKTFIRVTAPAVDQLQRRTADDVASLAHEYAAWPRSSAVAAGERALWPAAFAGIGGLLCVVGMGMLAASPAVPARERSLKRRLRLVGVGYLVVGGIGAAVGAVALGATVAHALPRTRHGLSDAVDAIRDRL